MAVFPWMTPPFQSPYGPLPAGFAYKVPAGYSSLVGANNVGKSAILQAIFRDAMHEAEIGYEGVCYLPSDRMVIAGTTEVAGRSLQQYNRDTEPYINSGPMNYESYPGPSRSELFRVLLNHADFMRQSQRVQELLEILGLPRMTLRQAQTLHFDMVLSGVQGSGMRSILPILAALSDTDLKLILIDEPEMSIEPTLQRSLRRLLVEEASEQRPIVVATQSHLLLDRMKPESVIAVSRESGVVTANAIETKSGLIDVTFRLLGNSLEDLYFPANFLIVEGASDQRIMQRVLELLGEPPDRIKVLSAKGVDRVGSTITAIEQALVPLVTSDSPYARRVVALVDQTSGDHRIDTLRAMMGDRLFELDQTSLEAYLPASLFLRVGLDKEAVLQEIEAQQDRRIKADIKRRTSESIAGAMTAGDIGELEIMRSAAEAAIARI